MKSVIRVHLAMMTSFLWMAALESLVSKVQDTFVDRMVTPSNQLDVDSLLRSADHITLRNEQITNPSLSKYWDMARDNQKNGFFV